MKIQLIAVGTKMPDWVRTGFEEYHRRFPKDMPFELLEITAGKRGKNADIAVKVKLSLWTFPAKRGQPSSSPNN